PLRRPVVPDRCGSHRPPTETGRSARTACRVRSPFVAFEPIRTERLILRRPEPGDVDAAFARRNLAEVARYQDWELPYTREQAERSNAKAVAMDGPTDGRGWSITVVDAAAPERILGDLYCELK